MTTNYKAVQFDSIQVGDELPSFEIAESQETIDGAAFVTDGDQVMPRNVHTDPEFAAEGLFAGTVNAGITTMAYVNQMLEQRFPASSFYDGGGLVFKAIDPFRPGRYREFHGQGRRQAGGGRKHDRRVPGPGAQPARQAHGRRRGDPGIGQGRRSGKLNGKSAPVELERPESAH